MQFLLLLSALLSAVTGAFGGPRHDAVQVDQVEARQVAGSDLEQIVVVAPARTETPEVFPRSVAKPVVIEAPAPVYPAPLAKIRLNE